MSDVISRQAAIEEFVKHCYPVRYGYNSVENGMTITGIKQVINEMPPAQPEPCEDAVSRKAVKDGFVEMCSLICPYTEKQRHIMCGSCLLGTAFDVLEATQPVTPKQRTGKWIDGIIPNDSGGLPVIVCDQCNTFFPLQFGDGHNFCPNCGAKMEGGAE